MSGTPPKVITYPYRDRLQVEGVVRSDHDALIMSPS